MLNQTNFSKKILSWFDRERQHIAVPGRKASDPYAIWIAEVMLQQTQVSTVQPYYQRWLKRFPSINVLAEAEQDQVLKLWEGLGYYSRARNLHQAATVVVDKFSGSLPNNSKDLLKIPGIGPYTAAAVASFAFHEAIPLIDGNVLRVLARIERIKHDIARPKAKTMIMEKLQTLIPDDHPGAFNQGLMDLGRVVCTPRNPTCASCPVSGVCQAFAVGDMEAYPVRTPKKKVPHYDIVIGLIRKGDDLLIQKRPAKGLLGGLWEFPGGKIEAGETAEAALLREIQEETSLAVNVTSKIGTIQHAYTHFKITLSAYFCEWIEGEAQTLAATENRWTPFDNLEQYAFPKANLKILKLIDR